MKQTDSIKHDAAKRVEMGKRLRELRTEMQLDQSDVGVQISRYDKMQISRMETGKLGIPLDFLIRCANHYGWNPGYILTGKGEKIDVLLKDKNQMMERYRQAELKLKAIQRELEQIDSVDTVRPVKRKMVSDQKNNG